MSDKPDAALREQDSKAVSEIVLTWEFQPAARNMMSPRQKVG